MSGGIGNEVRPLERMMQTSPEVSEVYRIADLSTSDFLKIPNIQQIVDQLYSSVQSHKVQIPPKETKKFILKLATIEDRIDQSTVLDPHTRKTLQDKLEQVEKILTGKNLYQEVGFVNQKESFVLNLWHHERLSISSEGELLFSQDVLKKLDDNFLDEILTFTGSKNLSMIRFIDLAKCPNLGLHAPAVVARHLKAIDRKSFAAMATDPERFCDHTLRVGQNDIGVNTEFLFQEIEYFKTLFTSIMRHGQEIPNVTVLTGMQYTPLRICIGLLTGTVEVSSDIDHDSLQKCIDVAQELACLKLFEALEPACVNYLGALIEAQDNTFEVVSSCITMFQFAFEAGRCTCLKQRLDKIILAAVDKKIEQIQLKMPKICTDIYFTMSITSFLLTWLPFQNFRFYDQWIVFKIATLMRKQYIPPGRFLDALDDLKNLFPDNDLILILSALQHIRKGKTSDWQEAKKTLELLAQDPERNKNKDFIHLLLADMVRLGAEGIPKNPQAAKDLIAQSDSKKTDAALISAQIHFKDEGKLDLAIKLATNRCAERYPHYLGYLLSHHPDPIANWARVNDLDNKPATSDLDIIARYYCFHYLRAAVGPEYEEKYFQQFLAAFMRLRAYRVNYSVALDIVHELPEDIQKRVAEHIEKLTKPI